MKHGIALLMVLLMLSLPMASAQRPAPGQDIDYTREEIVIIRNDTAGFVKLKLGEAEMSIHYGDGPISMLTVQTRYLGIADMYDEDDRHHKRLGIPVQSIMLQRLVGTLEYVDSNDNGLFDIDTSHGAGTLAEMKDTAIAHEPIIKSVDYREVSWTLSRWSEVAAGNEVQIDFVLSAENVATSDGTTVGRIEYIFHVTTVEQQIQVEAVPHYRVDFSAGQDRPDIRDSKLLARTNVTGHVLSSTWKYDQHIEGWGVSERNDTRLFTLTEMAMGSKFHPAVVDWMKIEFGHLVQTKAFAGRTTTDRQMESPPQVHDVQGNPLKCGVEYEFETDARATSDEDRQPTSDEDRQRVLNKIRNYKETTCRKGGVEFISGGMSEPEVIRAGGIHFDVDSARFGRIRWVSNATVDDVETEVLFQIHGARRVLARDVTDDPFFDCNENGIDDSEDISSGSSDDLNNNRMPDECEDEIIIGVRLVGGYNYVAGNDSYHDPEFGVDVLTIDPQGFAAPLEPARKGLMKLISMVSVLVIVVVAIGMAASRRREAPMPDASYTPTGPWASEDANWEQYRKN